MDKGAEELKIILDMAANGGKMQAQNEMLLDKIAQLESELKRVKNENKKLKNDLAEKTKECEELSHKNEELEARLMCEVPSENTETCAKGPVVMVNNFYYVLSWPKTVEYVGSLDANGRMSAGHFIHHTLPDGINMNFVKRVDELTKLEGPQDQRLADAMEKMAKRPTTQNIYGDKNDFQDGAQLLKMGIPDGADPAEIARQIAEQQKLLD